MYDYCLLFVHDEESKNEISRFLSTLFIFENLDWRGGLFILGGQIGEKGSWHISGFQVLLSLVLHVKGFYGTSISTKPVVSLWLLTSQLEITSKANKITTLLIKQLLATEVFGAQAAHWLWSVCYNLLESTITNLQKILSKNYKSIKEIIMPKLTVIFWDCIGI